MPARYLVHAARITPLFCPRLRIYYAFFVAIIFISLRLFFSKIFFRLWCLALDQDRAQIIFKILNIFCKSFTFFRSSHYFHGIFCSLKLCFGILERWVKVNKRLALAKVQGIGAVKTWVSLKWLLINLEICNQVSIFF